jgi:AGZA family xanthine/uracil permease-like MFS transporter
MAWLANIFEIERRGSTVGREVRGGIATFLTMAYILVANPAILVAAGIPHSSAVACTALAAGVSCLLMGLWGNFPLALASGMGLNAFVAYELAAAAGSWQTAMGLVVLDGLLILLLVLCGAREAMLRAIPVDLRRAIAAGIGLFIAFIGATNAGFIERFPTAGGPPVQPGALTEPTTLLAAIGVLVTAALVARKTSGALLIGMLFTTVAGFAWDVAAGTTHFLPAKPVALAWPSFESALQADVVGALQWKLVPLLLALMLVDFFDTLGTVTALADKAGLADKEGNIPRLRPILVVDSLSASIGGALGASSVTSYIESAAGVAEGARTGLHSVVVGLLFLAAIPLAPWLTLVPAAAVAPALILVGFLMCESLTQIKFSEPATGIPAFLTVLFIPLTYSIAHGIGIGFVSYVVLQLLAGRVREVHPLIAVAALCFCAYFAAGR